jgi:hypothetical protein
MNARSLIRWAGVAAIGAGVIFAVIQPIHPPDELASVTTSAWAVITAAKTAMCLLFLLGFTGLYARQVEKVGWLGLAGFLLLIFSWWLQTGFVFAEAFILPPLASEAPTFVDGLLGTIAAGRASEADLGVLPALYTLGVGIPYMLGGLLFGIATFRAGILPRWAAGILAVSGPLAMLMVALLPHQLERFAALPMGLAMAWLGYALWAEQRERVAEPVLRTVSS